MNRWYPGSYVVGKRSKKPEKSAGRICSTAISMASFTPKKDGALANPCKSKSTIGRRGRQIGLTIGDLVKGRGPEGGDSPLEEPAFKRLLTTAEAAAYLGLGPRTLYNGSGRRAKTPLPVKPKRIGEGETVTAGAKQKELS